MVIFPLLFGLVLVSAFGANAATVAAGEWTRPALRAALRLRAFVAILAGRDHAAGRMRIFRHGPAGQLPAARIGAGALIAKVGKNDCLLSHGVRFLLRTVEPIGEVRARQGLMVWVAGQR
jgi:hypothetical protein